jgi:hypothetical protein
MPEIFSIAKIVLRNDQKGYTARFEALTDFVYDSGQKSRRRCVRRAALSEDRAT